AAAHPRYHFEMALLRWMHVRKLVPLTELLDQITGGAPRGAAPAAPPRIQPPAPKPSVAPRSASPSAAAPPAAQPLRAPAPRVSAPAPAPAPSVGGGAVGGLKDALLAEIRSGKSFFYNMVVAQAQSIDVSAEGVVFAFLPTHRSLRERFEET